MAKKRARHSAELKREVCDLVLSDQKTVPEVCALYDLVESTVYGWVTYRNLEGLFSGNGESLDDELADGIDAVLSRFSVTSSVQTDRAKLTESFEAWVHILISPSKGFPCSGFSSATGVLTWPNSD